MQTYLVSLPALPLSIVPLIADIRTPTRVPSLGEDARIGLPVRRSGRDPQSFAYPSKGLACAVAVTPVTTQSGLDH